MTSATRLRPTLKQHSSTTMKVRIVYSREFGESIQFGTSRIMTVLTFIERMVTVQDCMYVYFKIARLVVGLLTNGTLLF